VIIQCYRCHKEIDTPNNFNADYIIAEDTKAKELRKVFVALKHNQVTRAKQKLIQSLEEGNEPVPPELTINDNEYDAVEIPNLEASSSIGEDLVKVVVEVKEKDIQKTGVICPECYRPTDFVIWGVHKGGWHQVGE
jgi:hypothetical protein